MADETVELSGSFSGYDILEVIGEGSFSLVYKVRHQLTNRTYAGKCLKKLFDSKKDILTCNEICAMKRIESHPNILGLIDLVCDDFPARVMIITQLMDINLFEYLKLRKRRLSEYVVRQLMQQLSSGVYYLHYNGLFHRDIKPENILLQLGPIGGFQSKPVTKVKLSDLGSSISIYASLPHEEYVATRWYRSPECLLTDGYYGPKMDVWALGCVFYEMITMEPLFPGDDRIDQINCVHKVLGTPNQHELLKFEKYRNQETYGIAFAFYKKIEFKTLLPNLSEDGLQVLKDTLQYFPEQRINSEKLYGHYYFYGSNTKKPYIRTSLHQSTTKLRHLRKYSKEFRDTKTIYLKEKLWGMSESSYIGFSKEFLLNELNRKSKNLSKLPTSSTA